jgi:hypothetical protein
VSGCVLCYIVKVQTVKCTVLLVIFSLCSFFSGANLARRPFSFDSLQVVAADLHCDGRFYAPCALSQMHSAVAAVFLYAV